MAISPNSKIKVGGFRRPHTSAYNRFRHAVMSKAIKEERCVHGTVVLATIYPATNSEPEDHGWMKDPPPMRTGFADLDEYRVGIVPRLF